MKSWGSSVLTGYNIDKLFEFIVSAKTIDVSKIINACRKVEFGCETCLVVQTAPSITFPPDVEAGQLYRTKFDDPLFNPRWENGTADYCKVIDLV